MLLDGQIENCIAIIDINLSNAELCLIDFFYQIFNTINYFYKAFFFKIYVLNSKNMNNLCQKHIIKSLSKFYVKAIEFFPEIDTPKLLINISKNQLISKYGGLVEISKYW